MERLSKRSKEKFGFEGTRSFGLEFEYPVVDVHKYNEIEVVKALSSFKEEGYYPSYDDVHCDQLVGIKNKEREVTVDAGKGQLEVIETPYFSLWEASKKYNSFFEKLYNFFLSKGGYILGYGIQPLGTPGNWNKKGRYDLLRKALPPEVNMITLGNSSQVHIDIQPEEVIPSINVVNSLSGVFTALFANSPICFKGTGRIAERETFWKSFASERSGIPPRFSSYEEYFQYLTQLPLILSKKNGKWVKIGDPFSTYWENNGQDYNDFLVHEATVWWDARIRSSFGTIEVRPACCQPHQAVLTVAVFSLGIIENLKEVSDFVREKSFHQWKKIKKKTIEKGMAGINLSLLKEVLFLAQEGLKKRKMNEEIFLDPLFERIEKGKSPGEEKLETFKKSGIPGLIESSLL